MMHWLNGSAGPGLVCADADGRRQVFVLPGTPSNQGGSFVAQNLSQGLKDLLQ